MKIGIIGSGNIGGTLSKLFARHGHEVAVANSRGPDTLAGLVQEAVSARTRRPWMTRPASARSSWSPCPCAPTATCPRSRWPAE